LDAHGNLVLKENFKIRFPFFLTWSKPVSKIWDLNRRTSYSTSIFSV